MADLEQIEKLFPFVSKESLDRFAVLEDLYRQWNEKINVISRKDIDNLFVHHILHSLSIAKICAFNKEAKILDVGTGGGFPGVPLAILFPKTKFHLIDRTAKKIRVVNAVVQDLQLDNVLAEQIACEQVKGTYDFVVSRAVTNMKDFLKMVKGKISKDNRHVLPNGILYLKGNDAYEELSDYPFFYNIYDLKNFLNDPYFESKCLVHLTLHR